MSESSTPHRPRAPRIPPFFPVPLRGRHDGWTPELQARFIGYLAETGSVCAAAERVGMSRNGAYRLRRKPFAESFAAAWDAALGAPIRKVATPGSVFLSIEGPISPVFFRGRCVGTRRKPSNSALLRHLAQLDRAAERGW